MWRKHLDTCPHGPGLEAGNGSITWGDETIAAGPRPQMICLAAPFPQDWRPKFNRANQFLTGQTAADMFFLSGNELKRLRRGNVLQCPGCFRCTLVAVEGCSVRSECCSLGHARMERKVTWWTFEQEKGEPGNRDMFQSWFEVCTTGTYRQLQRRFSMNHAKSCVIVCVRHLLIGTHSDMCKLMPR